MGAKLSGVVDVKYLRYVAWEHRLRGPRCSSFLPAVAMSVGPVWRRQRCKASEGGVQDRKKGASGGQKRYRILPPVFHGGPM